VVLIGLLALFVGLLGVYLGRLQIYPEGQAPIGENARFVTLVADFPYKKQVATVVVDVALIVLAYYTAYILRFEQALAENQERFVQSLPLVIACQLGAFALFRIYQGAWRHVGLHEAVTLAKASLIGVGLSVVAVAASFGLGGHSRSVFVLDWLLLIVGTAGSRLTFRAFAEYLRPATEDVLPVLVYGAGDGGVLVLRELRNNMDLGRRVVGFLDDDPSKGSTTIQGVPVVGGLDALEGAFKTYAVREVIVSSGKIAPDRVSALSAACDAAGVSVVRASLRFD